MVPKNSKKFRTVADRRAYEFLVFVVTLGVLQLVLFLDSVDEPNYRYRKPNTGKCLYHEYCSRAKMVPVSY